MQKTVRLLIILSLMIGPSLQGLGPFQGLECCCSRIHTEKTAEAFCCQSVISNRSNDGCACQWSQVTCRMTGCDCGCGSPTNINFLATLSVKEDSCPGLARNHDCFAWDGLISGWEPSARSATQDMTFARSDGMGISGLTPLQRCCQLCRWLL